MKKSRLLVLFIAVFFVFMSQAYAGGSDKTLGIGLHVGFQVPENPTVSSVKSEFTTDNGTSPTIGASLDLFILRDICASASVEYCNLPMNQKLSLTNAKSKIGNVSSVPLALTLRYQPTLMGMLMPYLGAGLGYTVNNLNQAAASWKLKDSPGYLLVGGMDVMLFGNNAVGVGLSYTWNSTKFTMNSLESNSFKMNDFEATIGLKHYF
jgi:outer membrane protein W